MPMARANGVAAGQAAAVHEDSCGFGECLTGALVGVGSSACVKRGGRVFGLRQRAAGA
jgi:hypothetical protein